MPPRRNRWNRRTKKPPDDSFGGQEGDGTTGSSSSSSSSSSGLQERQEEKKRREREERVAVRWGFLVKDVWESYLLALRAEAYQYLAQVHFAGPHALPPAPSPSPPVNPAG